MSRKILKHTILLTFLLIVSFPGVAEAHNPVAALVTGFTILSISSLAASPLVFFVVSRLFKLPYAKKISKHLGIAVLEYFVSLFALFFFGLLLTGIGETDPSLFSIFDGLEDRFSLKFFYYFFAYCFVYNATALVPHFFLLDRFNDEHDPMQKISKTLGISAVMGLLFSVFFWILAVILVMTISDFFYEVFGG